MNDSVKRKREKRKAPLRKTVDPCPSCFLHRERCVCASIPTLDLKTRLSLVIHVAELKRTTNTGRLALRALVNSGMFVRGGAADRVGPVDLGELVLPNYENYVLFPSDDAVDVESLAPKKPVHLIVSDGNWRQVSKLSTRHPELRHLPRVKISTPNLARHHLRKEHFQEGFSTLEAIALAFKALEGEDVGEKLMEVYRLKLHATLRGRGVL